MAVGRGTLLAGGLGVLCALAVPVRADDVVLPPVTAQATKETPSEGERAPASAQSVVEVAPREGEAATLPEVLATVPGAVVRDYGGPGQLATLSLRGASPQEVLILLDGQPLTGASSAMVDLATLPLGLLDRVEVIRGSVGAIYGPGAMGGVVNLVTRPPSSGPPTVSGVFTAGSFGTAEASLSGTGTVGPGTALVAATTLGTLGNFGYVVPNANQTAVRLNNDVEQVSALGRYRMALAGGTLDVRAEAEGEDRGLAGTTDNYSTFDRYREDLESASARYARALGPVQLEVRPYVRREQTQADVNGGTGAVEVDTAVGVEARAGLVLGSHALAGVVSGAGEWLTGASGNAETQALPGASSNPYARSELAVGVSDEWLLAAERVSILPAVRLDQVASFTGVSPGLAAAYRPLSGLELRASVGRSFRAPTLTELYVDQGLVAPNPGLQPETSDSAEVGAVWSRGTLAAQVALDAALYQNLITYQLALGDRLKPYNVATAGMGGAEVEARWQPLRSLTLSASYAYQRTIDLHDVAGPYLNELPYHPDHTGDVRAAWRGEWFRVQAEGFAQSSQHTVAAPPFDPLPARLLANAGASVRPLAAAPIWLGVEVKNLLDARTEDLYGYPLAGRAYYASLSFDTSPQEHR